MDIPERPALLHILSHHSSSALKRSVYFDISPGIQHLLLIVGLANYGQRMPLGPIFLSSRLLPEIFHHFRVRSVEYLRAGVDVTRPDRVCRINFLPVLGRPIQEALLVPFAEVELPMPVPAVSAIQLNLLLHLLIQHIAVVVENNPHFSRRRPIEQIHLFRSSVMARPDHRRRPMSAEHRAGNVFEQSSIMARLFPEFGGNENMVKSLPEIIRYEIDLRN